MSSLLEQAVPYLKVAIVILVVCLVALTAGLVMYVISPPGTQAPRSELERAVFAAEEAVKANPQDASARIKLSAAYLEENSVGAALQQARYAVRLAPKDPTSYYVLGLAQEASGDTKVAQASLTKAVTTKGQLASFYSDAYAALARVQEGNGNTKGALKTMGKAVDNDPENAVLLFTRGQMYERDRQWVWALDDYGEAVAYVPDYAQAREAYDQLAKEHPEAVKKLKEIYGPGTTNKKPNKAGK